MSVIAIDSNGRKMRISRELSRSSSAAAGCQFDTGEVLREAVEARTRKRK